MQKIELHCWKIKGQDQHRLPYICPLMCVIFLKTEQVVWPVGVWYIKNEMTQKVQLWHRGFVHSKCKLNRYRSTILRSKVKIIRHEAPGDKMCRSRWTEWLLRLQTLVLILSTHELPQTENLHNQKVMLKQWIIWRLEYVLYTMGL